MNDLSPQTDLELLTLAAKATGVVFDQEKSMPRPLSGAFWGLWLQIKGETYEGQRRYWSPHTDDGDCARMEAALGIQVAWHSDGVVCGLRWAGATELFDDHGGDKQAARRMASLRVAAEHGKTTP